MNKLAMNFYIVKIRLSVGPAAGVTGLVVAVIFFVAMLVIKRTILEMDFILSGDFAADVLQTQRVTQSWLLTGHYSFAGVNHPGPFFLYVRLLAQWLVGGWTGSVFGAQFVGLIACNAFFAGLFATLIQRLAEYQGACRWTAAGTALSSMVLVLFELWHDMIDPWMPHVIILPFLTFLTAGILTIRGNGYGLLISTFCAAALVHAYIPMPIVVGPVWLFSLVRGWRMRRTATGHGFSYEVWRGVLMIILCFLAPLAIDAFINPPGNTFRILQTALQTKYATPSPSFYQLMLFLRTQWLTLSPVYWPIIMLGIVIGMIDHVHRPLLCTTFLLVGLSTLTVMLTFAQAPTPLRPYSAYFFVAPALLMAVCSAMILVLKLTQRLGKNTWVVIVMFLTGVFAATKQFPPKTNRGYFSMESDTRIRHLSRAIAAENPPGSRVVLTVPNKSSRELPHVRLHNPVLAGLLLDLDNFGISSCYPDPALSFYVTPDRICSRDHSAVRHVYRIEKIPMCRLSEAVEQPEKIGQGTIVLWNPRICVYIYPYDY
jgi:hypothetical protein